MVIEQEPFTKYNLDSKTDTFTIRLNEDERKRLEDCKKILEQPKDSTAFKQLAFIGANVLHDDLTGTILADVFKNKRNNKRLGIVDFEQ